MTVFTTAGSSIAVTASAPATFDAAGYAALFDASPAPATIGEVADLGEFGREYVEVTWNPIDTRATKKAKGSYNEGTIALNIGLDNDNAGQALLYTASTDDADYYFAITLQNGDRYFFSAKVMSFRVVAGSVDSITQANVNLSLTSNNEGVGVVRELAA